MTPSSSASTTSSWYDRAIEYEIHRQAERKAARNDTPVEPVKRGDFMTPTSCTLRDYASDSADGKELGRRTSRRLGIPEQALLAMLAGD